MTSSPTAKKIVVGASGFLGSHVAKRLVAAGEDVRVLIRPTSSTRGIDGLDVECHHGDVFDADSIRRAIDGCDVVYYCVVDARPWLRDPAPMWRTNVDGLRTVLDVAVDFDLRRFVYTSSIATIGLVGDGLATEATAHNWLDRGGEYVRTRVAAEDLVLRYSRERGLPGVAMCVANTYGPGDWLPTPHGGFVADAARGRMPFYIRGARAQVVAVEDAAEAMILAAAHGRNAQRYIVAERDMSSREILDTACAAVGVAPPRVALPVQALAAAATLSSAWSRVTHRETRLTPTTVRLMHIMTPLDHSKAVDELGWHPRPTPEAIAEAARFFVGAEYRTRKVTA